MIHERHYTVAEANAELGRLEPLLARLREAKDELLDTDAREALVEASTTNGGGTPGKQVGEAFLEVRSMLVELTEMGIVVRDVDRGLVDFPAVLEGREVYLCWELGESEVAHWHELDSGYDARQPLD